MQPPEHAWIVGRGREIPLDRPRLMAILNITPDSFSDGGDLPTLEAVVAAARHAVDSGASILDIGGESTRPGATRVTASDQIARVVPAITAIRRAGPHLADIPISIDTTLAEVARAALNAGADAINDVSGAAEDPAILDLAAARRAGLVLMHRALPPGADRYSTDYGTRSPLSGDSVKSVVRGLAGMLERACAAGMDERSIILDPGLGFGKTVEQNVELIQRTPELLTLGRPVLSAASRKSFVGALSVSAGASLPPRERLAGSLAFSIEHLRTGARLFRVHDVAAQAQALTAAWNLGVGKPR